MQNILIKLRSNSRAMLGIILVVCLFALGFAFTATIPAVNDGNPVVAEAATITASNFRSALGTSGSISGNFELASDITVSAGNGWTSTATYNGTFDGKGHTITVNGSITHESARNTNNYVGFFFGQLGPTAVIKNVHIVWNASWNEKAYNNAQSGSYSGEGSTTTYLGIIAGSASNGSKIEDVTLTLNSTVAGIGLDDGTDHEKQTGGQGFVVGGLIGRSLGAKLKNITFNNNGSVWARGHNVSAGSNRKGVVVNLSENDSRGDRAAAGGLIGEAQSNATTINSLVFKGNGIVGAAVTGGSTAVVYDAQYYLYCNFAGGILGLASGGSFTIDGMLYEYYGSVYVKETYEGTHAGVILGKGSNVSVKNLWRRTNDQTKDSSRGQSTYYSPTAGPTKSGLSTHYKSTGKLDSTISGVSQGNKTADIVETKSKHEYLPSAYHGQNSIGAASGTVTDVKDGYISVQAVSNDATYLISALSYQATQTSANVYKNYYQKGESTNVLFSTAEYKIPVSCYNFRVSLATKVKSIYSTSSGNQNYNASPITFTGAPDSNNLKLYDNLFWMALHESDYNYGDFDVNKIYNEIKANPNSHPNSRIGELSSSDINTGINVGSYYIVLCRYDSNNRIASLVNDGETLGASSENAPSTIYTYDKEKADREFIFKIDRTEVELVQLSSPYSREYDGTYKVSDGALTYQEHYGFYLAGTTQAPPDEPEFKIGNGVFYNAENDQLDANVSSNKYVIITGIEVLGNYKLAEGSATTFRLDGCSIVQRKVTYEWEWPNLEKKYVYNGDIIKPSIKATNLIGNDKLNFTVTVYNSLMEATTGTNPINSKLDVKDGSGGTEDCYYAKATIESNPNYVLANGSAQDKFYVIPKEIGLTWTSFNATFNYVEYFVNCVVTDANTEVYNGEDVGLGIVYSLNGEIQPLKNAGSYVAIASLSNKNYKLKAESATFDKIKISPIALDVEFYTGTSNTVQNLVYKGVTYKNSADGLHAKLATSSLNKGLIDENIAITFEGEVKNCGTYQATASFVYSPLNPNEDILITNYAVANPTYSVTIVPRAITLTYNYDNDHEFTYDGLPKTIEGYVGDGVYDRDNVSVRSKITQNNKVVNAAINAGNYVVTYELNNSNYVIDSQYSTRNLKINPYNISQANSLVSIDSIPSQVYTAESITPDCVIRFNGIIQVTNFNAQYSNNVNAGTATVTITGINNFTGFITTNFTITKATLDVEFTSIPSTYTGEVQHVEAKFTGYKGNDEQTAPVGATVTYLDNKTPKDAGTYTAVVSFDGEPFNYLLTSKEENKKVTFTIVGKEVKIKFLGINNLVFDGTNHVYNATNNPEGVRVVFDESDPEKTLCEADKEFVVLNISFKNSSNEVVDSLINAGTYTATASLGTNGNGGQDKNYTIAKVAGKPDPSIETFRITECQIGVGFEPLSLVHNYSAKQCVPTYFINTPIVEGHEPGVSLRFLSLESNKYVDGNPINAGQYNIEVTLRNKNYTLNKETQNTSVQFSIAKAPLKVVFNITEENYYNGRKIEFSPSFVEGYSLLLEDRFVPTVKYYNENGDVIDKNVGCVNAGNYSISAELPYDDINYGSIARNYYLLDAENGLYMRSFTIKPRFVSVIINADSFSYNGKETRDDITAVLGNDSGRISDGSYYYNSGVVTGQNGGAEKVTFSIEMYSGNDTQGSPLDFIREVGTYTIVAKLDSSNLINANYLLYEENQTKYPTSKTITISPKDVKFNVIKSDSFNPEKTYGDPDTSIIMQLTQSNSNIISGDELYVKLTREEGEIVGEYAFVSFVPVKKVDIDGEISYVETELTNYTLAFGPGLQEKFAINKKQILFSPNTFKRDYNDEIGTLTQTISFESSVVGLVEITIVLKPENVNECYKGANAGKYNLHETDFTYNNSENVDLIMRKGENLDKIEIIGRSVKVLLGFSHSGGIYNGNRTYTIIFGQDEPDYYLDWYVDLDKCDQDIRDASEIDRRNYIQISRVANEISTDETLLHRIPYKAEGYNIQITFKKKVGNTFEIDPNYRAVIEYQDVDEFGNVIPEIPATYKLMVEKFDLGTVFNKNKTFPEVNPVKDYDGNNSATIINHNIPLEYQNHLLSVIARYTDQNAGDNKTINLYYSIGHQIYANNYILPGDNGVVEYMSTASINKVNLNVSFNPNGIYSLVYGQTYSTNPQSLDEVKVPSLEYYGFKGSDNAQNVGLDFSVQFDNNVDISTLLDAGNHTLIIVDNKNGNYTNYNIVVANPVTVNVEQKGITVKAGKPFEKTYDSTDIAEITSENFVIEGLIDKDKNDENAVIIYFTSKLTSKDPGTSSVEMMIVDFDSKNYKLAMSKDDIIYIDAIIKELAVVEFNQDSFELDFTGNKTELLPNIKEIQEGVKFVVKYQGRTWDGIEYPETTEAPKSAGRYTVICYFYHEKDEASNNREERALAQAEIVINKVMPKIHFVGTQVQTYGSFTEINAILEAPGSENINLDVNYSFANEDGTLPTFAPAGRHTVTAYYEESNNYLGARGEYSMVIKPKSITVTFDGYKNLVYNGLSRNDDVKAYFTGVVEGDTCEPIKIFNVDMVKNAGNYRLIVTPSNSSYEISGTHAVDFTIAKKTLTVSVPDGITTEAGVMPEISILYYGFVENEDASVIDRHPAPRVVSAKVGANVIEFVEGLDDNYSFNYVKGIYTVTYESPNEDKPNVTPYAVAGGVVGGIGLIFGLGYFVKIANYKAITRSVAKRQIRKAMYSKKGIKK